MKHLLSTLVSLIFLMQTSLIAEEELTPLEVPDAVEIVEVLENTQETEESQKEVAPITDNEPAEVQNTHEQMATDVEESPVIEPESTSAQLEASEPAEIPAVPDIPDVPSAPEAPSADEIEAQLAEEAELREGGIAEEPLIE